MQGSATKDRIIISEQPIARSFKKQLFAMFFAGLAVDQTITHWVLNTAQLPIKTSIYTLTPQLNIFASIFWPILAALLLIYSWPRNVRQET
jgi:dipeptide/tripeptide permease